MWHLWQPKGKAIDKGKGQRKGNFFQKLSGEKKKEKKEKEEEKEEEKVGIRIRRGLGVFTSRLSKCVVLYQYDTTWLMCLVNDTNKFLTRHIFWKYWHMSCCVMSTAHCTTALGNLFTRIAMRAKFPKSNMYLTELF